MREAESAVERVRRLTVVDVQGVHFVLLQIIVNAAVQAEHSVQGVHLVPHDEVLYKEDGRQS